MSRRERHPCELQLGPHLLFISRTWAGKGSTEDELVLLYPKGVLAGAAAPGGEGCPSPHALGTTLWAGGTPFLHE